MSEFKLPFLGPDVEEAKLLSWQIQPGETVRRGQVVCVVDTAKAAVDVEAWQEGTVQELLVAPGEQVHVGQPLLQFAANGGEPVPVSRQRVSPAARKLAQSQGIALGSVQGTGPEGTVLLDDVQRAIGSAAGTMPQSPLPNMRQVIAAAMSRSKREIPHYYLSEEIPLAAAQAWLEEQNAQRSIEERFLMAALFLKAAALALDAAPSLNGWFTDGMFHSAPAANIGVAIALHGGGLVAPALQDVAMQPLPDLMRNLGDLVRRARAGTLRSSEMSGGTITVTNLGEQGCSAAFGVIYPPQVALVGFGRVRDMPWVVDGRLQPMPMVTASLAGDHRVTDGHEGARYLVQLNALLQQPDRLAWIGGAT